MIRVHSVGFDVLWELATDHGASVWAEFHSDVLLVSPSLKGSDIVVFLDADEVENDAEYKENEEEDAPNGNNSQIVEIGRAHV